MNTSSAFESEFSIVALMKIFMIFILKRKNNNEIIGVTYLSNDDYLFS